MHAEALAFVSRFASPDPLSVIEIGSRDINGTVRPLFPAAAWTGLDLSAGPAVDIVCDAAEYQPAVLVDLVICCEVFEHAPNWMELIRAAWRFIKPGGRLVATCAGPGRLPHSAIDGGQLQPNEHYENLNADQIADACRSSGFTVRTAESKMTDTYVFSEKAANETSEVSEDFGSLTPSETEPC